MRVFDCLFYVLILIFLSVVSVQAVKVKELDMTVDINAVSAYVQRGMILNDEPCIQPSIDIRADDLALNIWGTWDLTDVTNSSSRTRMDVKLDYTKQVGRNIFKAGVISYIYHDDSRGQAKDTFELQLDYAVDIPRCPILPSLTINYDFGEIQGVYSTLGLASFVPLKNKIWDMDMYFFLSAGDANYVNYSFNPADPDGGLLDASLIDFEARLAFPYKSREYCTITPEVRYVMLIGSDIKDQVEQMGLDTDEIIYSVSMAFAF